MSFYRDATRVYPRKTSPITSRQRLRAPSTILLRRSGYGASSRTASKAGRVVKSASGPTKTAAARLDEQVAAARYAYFKANRATLPPRIAEYSGEIDQLLKKGKPVEEAFDEVIKKYF